MSVPTSYSKFKFEHLALLGLRVKIKPIFGKEVTAVQPSNWLLETLRLNQKAMPLSSEKGRSEALVYPILVEARNRNQNFMLFSGSKLDVERSLGLNGHCDFLLSNVVDSPYVEAPIIAIVEAKNDNVQEGVPQCVAEMFASRLFNERRNSTIKVIHGIVTSGTEWLFLRLDENNEVTQNDGLFVLNELPELLGALQTILDFYKD